MSREKIVDRVRKLLNLADEEGGGTDGERDAALAKAQALMNRHRIEEHELAREQGRPLGEGIRAKPFGVLTLKDRWQYYLLYAIGENVGVDAVMAPLGKGSTTIGVQLVGRPESIEYVDLVARWIIPQLEAEAARALLQSKTDAPMAGNPGERAGRSIKFRKSFMEGAVMSIRARLEEAHQRESTGSQGLVLHDKAAKAEFYGDSAPRESRSNWEFGEGSLDGIATGDRVDIDPRNKVSGDEARKELG